jgi:hypothetical protein
MICGKILHINTILTFRECSTMDITYVLSRTIKCIVKWWFRICTWGCTCRFDRLLERCSGGRWWWWALQHCSGGSGWQRESGYWAGWGAMSCKRVRILRRATSLHITFSLSSIFKYYGHICIFLTIKYILNLAVQPPWKRAFTMLFSLNKPQRSMPFSNSW